MPRRLIKNAEVLVTMDEARREIAKGCLVVDDNRITHVGTLDAMPDDTDAVVDLAGHVVLPGLVNTHHHMYQSLTRAVPAGQDEELLGWLRALYPLWTRLTPDIVKAGLRTTIAELLLSGCTTSADMQPVYPNGCRIDDTIEVAAEMGLRFHACRGAVTVGVSAGSVTPDVLCEREDDILRDMRRVIEAHHDARRFAMCRVAVSPVSPFQVKPDLMRQCASLARQYGAGLHTHLAENDGDVALSEKFFGMTPQQFVEDVGWIGPDVWHAHCVKLDDEAVRLFGRTGTGVAHCPCSNMRLGSGIAPLAAMRRAGVPVGLGVDGSASNDSGHMLAEVRQAMLLARVAGGPQALGARDALELATRGGARVLGRSDIGVLAPDMAADIVAFDIRHLDFAGALHDPVAALVFCTPARAAFSMIDGHIVVRDGALVGHDLGRIVTAHNAAAKALAG